MTQLTELREYIQRIWASIRPTQENIEDSSAPFLLAVGIIYLMVLIFTGQWLAILPFCQA
jgi:hypothetical protein